MGYGEKGKGRSPKSTVSLTSMSCSFIFCPHVSSFRGWEISLLVFQLPLEGSSWKGPLQVHPVLKCCRALSSDSSVKELATGGTGKQVPVWTSWSAQDPDVSLVPRVLGGVPLFSHCSSLQESGLPDQFSARLPPQSSRAQMQSSPR